MIRVVLMKTESNVGLCKAFTCAAAGIAQTAKERNFKIELGFMVAAIVLGIVFSVSHVEWLVMIVCFGMVLGGEVINSSVEAIVDLASPEYNELARISKDCAAGGVLLFSIASFVIGCFIFIPRILSLLGC